MMPACRGWPSLSALRMCAGPPSVPTLPPPPGPGGPRCFSAAPHRLWASTSLLPPQPWLGKSVGFGITSSRVWIWTLSLAALGKWVSLCQPGFLYL